MPKHPDNGAGELVPSVPRKARTVLKRQEPGTASKDDSKAVARTLSKKSRSKPAVAKVTTEKEQEVAEALFDLANLATFMESEEAPTAAADGLPSAKRRRQRPRQPRAEEGTRAGTAKGEKGMEDMEHLPNDNKYNQKGARDNDGSAVDLASVPNNEYTARPRNKGKGVRSGSARPTAVSVAQNIAIASPSAAIQFGGVFPNTTMSVSAQYYPAAAAMAAAAGSTWAQQSSVSVARDDAQGMGSAGAASVAVGGVFGRMGPQQPRPFKHCATHVYIAHFIDYQQQVSRHALLQQHFSNLYSSQSTGKAGEATIPYNAGSEPLFAVDGAGMCGANLSATSDGYGEPQSAKEVIVAAPTQAQAVLQPASSQPMPVSGPGASAPPPVSQASTTEVQAQQQYAALHALIQQSGGFPFTFPPGVAFGTFPSPSGQPQNAAGYSPQQAAQFFGAPPFGVTSYSGATTSTGLPPPIPTMQPPATTSEPSKFGTMSGSDKLMAVPAAGQGPAMPQASTPISSQASHKKVAPGAVSLPPTSSSSFQVEADARTRVAAQETAKRQEAEVRVRMHEAERTCVAAAQMQVQPAAVQSTLPMPQPTATPLTTVPTPVATVSQSLPSLASGQPLAKTGGTTAVVASEITCSAPAETPRHPQGIDVVTTTAATAARLSTIANTDVVADASSRAYANLPPAMVSAAVTAVSSIGPRTDATHSSICTDQGVSGHLAVQATPQPPVPTPLAHHPTSTTMVPSVGLQLDTAGAGATVTAPSVLTSVHGGHAPLESRL